MERAAIGWQVAEAPQRRRLTENQARELWCIDLESRSQQCGWLFVREWTSFPSHLFRWQPARCLCLLKAFWIPRVLARPLPPGLSGRPLHYRATAMFGGATLSSMEISRAWGLRFAFGLKMQMPSSCRSTRIRVEAFLKVARLQFAADFFKTSLWGSGFEAPVPPTKTAEDTIPLNSVLLSLDFTSCAWTAFRLQRFSYCLLVSLPYMPQLFPSVDSSAPSWRSSLAVGAALVEPDCGPDQDNGNSWLLLSARACLVGLRPKGMQKSQAFGGLQCPLLGTSLLHRCTSLCQHLAVRSNPRSFFLSLCLVKVVPDQPCGTNFFRLLLDHVGESGCLIASKTNLLHIDWLGCARCKEKKRGCKGRSFCFCTSTIPCVTLYLCCVRSHAFWKLFLFLTLSFFNQWTLHVLSRYLFVVLWLQFCRCGCHALAIHTTIQMLSSLPLDYLKRRFFPTLRPGDVLILACCGHMHGFSGFMRNKVAHLRAHVREQLRAAYFFGLRFPFFEHALSRCEFVFDPWCNVEFLAFMSTRVWQIDLTPLSLSTSFPFRIGSYFVLFGIYNHLGFVVFFWFDETEDLSQASPFSISWDIPEESPTSSLYEDHHPDAQILENKNVTTTPLPPLNNPPLQLFTPTPHPIPQQQPPP